MTDEYYVLDLTEGHIVLGTDDREIAQDRAEADNSRVVSELVDTATGDK